MSLLNYNYARIDLYNILALRGTSLMCCILQRGIIGLQTCVCKNTA